MPWEPTTRGTTPSQNACHYGSCRGHNTRLEYYIVDASGNRWFCDDHWKWVCLFFQIVKDCKKCKRNYGAEYYKDERHLDSMKFDNKWYDVCLSHFRVLDKELCVLFSDTDLTFLD